MKSLKHIKRNNKASALIIAMVFIIVFASLSVALVSLSGTNIQIASNQHKLGLARASADSGLEFVRYWLSRVYIPGDTLPSDRFARLCNLVQANMAASGVYATFDYNGEVITGINFPCIEFDPVSGQGFTAAIRPDAYDSKLFQVYITGTGQNIGRTIKVNYKFISQNNSAFNYGVATRGPLSLAGNIQLEGYNISVESDVYIESLKENEALSIIGNSQIAGEVKIVNPEAYATLQGGKVSVGGQKAPQAYNHIDIGIPPADFPVPLPNIFRHYIEGDIDMNDTIHTNVRIPPNTNPNFAGGTQFSGILFIESPNVVVFSGHVSITGIIIGNGNLNDNSGINSLHFLGTVDSYPVADLNPSQFGELVNETGTFLMAPGFAVSFGGNFETLNGVIAANGVEFFGNAGGIINGSVINYSTEAMTLSGNSDLMFNHSGITEAPSGFGPQIILDYIPNSYSEVFDI